MVVRCILALDVFYTMADNTALINFSSGVYKARSADKIPSGIAGQVT